MLKKSNLEDGCLVKTKGGEVYEYVQELGRFVKGIGYLHADNYDENLKHNFNNNWSVVEIYYKNEPSKAENTLVSILEDEKLSRVISSINSMREEHKKYAIDLLKSGKVELGYFELNDTQKMNYMLIKDIFHVCNDYFSSLSGELDLIETARTKSHKVVTSHHVACQLGITYDEVVSLGSDKYYGKDENIFKGLSKFAIWKRSGGNVDTFLMIHKDTTTKDNRMLREFEVLI